jgi:4-hydroxythreonine-4-phosphate dehydrogenase
MNVSPQPTPDKRPPIAVTCGDPAGIGPEIIVAWLNNEKAVHHVVLGPQPWLDSLPDTPGLIKTPVGEAAYTPQPGQPSEAGATIALAALEEAASGCRDGRYAGVVTAPISKTWLQRIGFTHPGHTEFFAERWGGEPTMAFAGGRLRVVLATWHIPLSSVPDALTETTLKRACERAAWLAEHFVDHRPVKIGVCGLNPHAGEGGLLGDEETTRFNPWLHTWRQQLPGLSDCQPGDTVFRQHLLGDYDVVVALYHDQGLAPLKTLEFERSVNITLGLPWIRTSPDHGTAFGLAGRGSASATSFIEAVRMADRLCGKTCV